MVLKKIVLSLSTILVCLATAAKADPALVYDLGGKFDKSYNEAAYNGAKKWAEDTGGKYRDIELQTEAQREQALRRLAESGSNPVVMVGFSFASALKEVAPDYPKTKFVIADMVVEAPNVSSVVFKEHEGSYLVGLLAAMASKSNTVGFVGGMDIPIISRFACGYAQGVKSVNPEAKVIVNMTGSSPSAWNDPVKGSELTKTQISQGADVVFHAASSTGIGVLQAAADGKILGIGVDSNQNHLHPGSVLTSMIKRVDVAVYNAFSAGKDVESGLQVMGLSNDGVGYSVDSNNAPLLTDAMQSAVEAAKAKIIAGDIVVHDYMEDTSCPSF